MAREEDLERIGRALDEARRVLAGFQAGQIAHRAKPGGQARHLC